MIRRLVPTLLTVVLAMSFVLAFGAPALADHTDPNEAQSPTQGAPAAPLSSKGGGWEHVAHFPPNPGTDLEFFTKNGQVYSSSGTLGQGSEGHVGQRILELTDAEGNVAPSWVADHG